jgi:hypothetical protein
MVKGSIASFLDGIAASHTYALLELGDESDLRFPAVLKQKTGDLDSGTAMNCVWDVPPAPLSYEVQVGIYLGVACCISVFVGGVLVFLRRMDKDNQEDWLVKVESAPLTGSATLITPGSMGFNLGTGSLKRDIYDDDDNNNNVTV